MKIETKFEVGDDVYFFYNNKVYKKTIKWIEINIYMNANKLKIVKHYKMDLGETLGVWALSENHIFSTTRDLYEFIRKEIRDINV